VLFAISEGTVIPQEFANQQNVGAGSAPLGMRRDLWIDCSAKDSG
jgi:hypothetical protein